MMKITLGLKNYPNSLQVMKREKTMVTMKKMMIMVKKPLPKIKNKQIRKMNKKNFES